MARRKITEEEENITIGEENIKYLMKSAAELGIQHIYNNFPIFRGAEGLLSKHMDWKNLRAKAEEIYSGLIENQIDGERARDYIQKELADYVESGKFFDEKGKEIVTKKSIEWEPNLWEKLFSRFKPKSEGEKELNNTINVLHDSYLLYQSKGQSISELKEPFEKVKGYLSKLEGADFVPAFANVLEAYGRIDSKEADSLRRMYSQNLESRIKEGKSLEKEVTSGLQEYAKRLSSPQKIAASVFLIFGIGMILFNLAMTGAAIGTYVTMTNNIVGGILICISMILFSVVKKNI